MNHEFQPDYSVKPGETIIEMLENIGMTLKEFSNQNNIRIVTMLRVINAKQSIEPDIANALARVTHTKPQFWMNLETNYLATNRRLHPENKQLYYLTAKNKNRTAWRYFDKGDGVFTYNPENYGTEHFNWILWDEKREIL